MNKKNHEPFENFGTESEGFDVMNFSDIFYDEEKYIEKGGREDFDWVFEDLGE